MDLVEANSKLSTVKDSLSLPVAARILGGRIFDTCHRPPRQRWARLISGWVILGKSLGALSVNQDYVVHKYLAELCEIRN